VTFPSVEVDRMKGENLSPEYLGKNPIGRMPLLELDDGTFIAESVAICHRNVRVPAIVDSVIVVSRLLQVDLD
jgi:hypothetical protein